PLVVGVVVVRQPERELEAASSDQLAQSLQARFDVASLPASDLRLRALDAPSELRLAEPGPQARLPQQICTNHKYIYAIRGEWGRSAYRKPWPAIRFASSTTGRPSSSTT